MLLVVTLCWGISYVLTDVALYDMGPFTLNAYRFLGAFFIAFLLTCKSLVKVSKETLKYAVIVGGILFFVYMGATFGVMYTTLSNTGFLCALTVIFVPIFEFAFLRKKPQAKIIIAATMSLIGIMLLTLKDDFSFNLKNIWGDLASVLCAFSYTADLLIMDKALRNPNVNAYHLGVFQLGVTGLLMMTFSMFFENPHLPRDRHVIFAVVFLSIFCTGLAFIVQSIAQKYTTATHVGVIFALEPVFAGVAAYFYAGEVLTFKSYIGALLMIIALFITVINFPSKGQSKVVREEPPVVDGIGPGYTIWEDEIDR